MRYSAPIRLKLVFGLIAAATLAWAPSAQAKFITGIDSAGLFLSSDAGERTRWFDTAVNLRAGIVRIDVLWDEVATGKPANPADPADPAYDFGRLDAAIRDAAARQLGVVLTFYSAPGYARGGGEPNSAVSGTWKPDPAALGNFARAVATRYSGGYQGLPRVRYFDAWNEPNFPLFLQPQYEGRKPVAVERYRKMLNQVADAVKSVQADNQVIAGSLAPYGDDPGGGRIRPLAFLRELLCLNGKLRGTKCPSKPRFDILAHHPINLSGGPRQSARDPDDASSPDMKHVARVLRAAERAHTIRGGGKRHPLWVTEFWWESFPEPPSGDRPVPGLEKHGRWVEETLYLLWKAGVSTAIYYQLRDDKLDPQRPDQSLQIGLFLEGGAAKPAATAFRFPFLTHGGSGGVRAWGKAPAGGKLRIERKTKGGWRKVGGQKVRPGEVFTERLKVGGRAQLRARVAGLKSLIWKQGGGGGSGKLGSDPEAGARGRGVDVAGGVGGGDAESVASVHEALVAPR